MTMVPAHQSHSNKRRSLQQRWRQSANHASNHSCYNHHHHRHPDPEHLINCSDLVSSCTSEERILFGGANHHMSYDYSNYSYYCDQSCLGSEFLAVSPHGQMADHHHHHQQQFESRTNSISNETASTSSKDNNTDRAETNDDEGWLQLTIGSHTRGCELQLTSSAPASQNINRHLNDGKDDDLDHAQQHYAADPATMPSTTSADSGLVELDLISSGPGGSHSLQLAKHPLFQLRPVFHQIPEIHVPPRQVTNYDYTIGREEGSAAASASGRFGLPTLPYTQQAPGSGSSSVFLPREINNWTRTLWPGVPSPQYSMGMMPSSLSSSSSSSASSFSSLRPLGSIARPLQFQFHAHAAGPSSDIIRVVEPPRTPHSGLWFILQASQNQVKEPFLPQISKSFLRIKDGRMTVRLVMKYLVNKFKLDSESEIEITCRGQQLAPFLTLQHVRDNIWSRRDTVTLLPDSPSTDHLMMLHYARRCS